MSLEEDIGKSVLEAFMELLPGFKRQWFVLADDATRARVVDRINSSVRDHMKDDRKMMAGFIDWWANRAHQDHLDKIPAGNAPETWRTCPMPICISLAGTLQEFISHETPPLS